MTSLTKIAILSVGVRLGSSCAGALAAMPAVVDLGDLRPENGGDGQAGFVLHSSTPLQGQGNQESKALIVRDLNGDGRADLVLAVPQAEGVSPDAGIGFVLFGRSTFPARVDLESLSGADGFDMVIGDGAMAGEELGKYLSPIGDFNGDGLGDILISSYKSPYVLFGHPVGLPFPAHVTLGSLSGNDGFKIVLALSATGTMYVSATDSGGDANGDGIDDVLISEPAPPGESFSASGAVYFVNGHQGAFTSTLDLASLDGSNGYRLDGDPARNSLGAALAGQADIDRDGHVDLVTIDAVDSTRGVVVFGRAGTPPSSLPLPALDGIAGFEFLGDMQSSYTTAAGGDINGDGWPDMVFSEGLASPSGNRTVYVVFGGPRPFPASLRPADLNGRNGFAYLAEYPSSEDHVAARFIGDVNGDGIDDLAIRTQAFAPPGTSRSIVHVLYGRRDGFPASFDESALDGVHGFRIEDLGSTGDYINDAAGIGDLNGDGIDDLVVSVDHREGEGIHPAAGDFAYVIYGRESSLFANGFEASVAHRPGMPSAPGEVQDFGECACVLRATSDPSELTSIARSGHRPAAPQRDWRVQKPLPLIRSWRRTSMPRQGAGAICRYGPDRRPIGALGPAQLWLGRSRGAAPVSLPARRRVVQRPSHPSRGTRAHPTHAPSICRCRSFATRSAVYTPRDVRGVRASLTRG